jgi:hypothetical protein
MRADERRRFPAALRQAQGAPKAPSQRDDGGRRQVRLGPVAVVGIAEVFSARRAAATLTGHRRLRSPGKRAQLVR